MQQSQKFAMNPQVYQSIKLMEMPLMDLREKIGEELEKNPALEVLEDPTVVSLDAATAPKKEEDEYFESTSDSGFISKGEETTNFSSGSDERLNFIEGALSHPETLQEHLLWQLSLEPVDENIRRIAEYLIQNLNEDGFHKEPVALLFQNEDGEMIKKAQTVVQ